MEAVPESNYPEPVRELEGNSQPNYYGAKGTTTAYVANSSPPAANGYDYNTGNYGGGYVGNSGVISPEKQKAPRTLCGLRRTTFWLAVALAVVIIVAVIGGSVGGITAKHNSEKAALASISAAAATRSAAADFAPTSSSSSLSSATPTSQSTPATKTTTKSYTASAISTKTVLATTATPSTGCPERNGTIYTGAHGEQLQIACNQNYPQSDLLEVPIPIISFDSCMDLCYKWNQTLGSEQGPKCVGVSFNANSNDATTLLQKFDSGECFLKSMANATNQGSDENVASAIVVKSGNSKGTE